MYVKYNASLQLDFPIHNLFLLGSPVGMFCSVYSEEAFVRSKLPTCQNFYNLFHPSDLVAYRIEPLIKQYSYEDNSFKEFSPEGGLSKRLGNKADYSKSIYELYEEEKDDDMPPPVLVPCYWNKGLNKA